MQSFETVDDYIASFPEDTQKVLGKLRNLIHKIEPDVTEDMSYKMPSFKLNGKPLVYFAAWQDHIGFYPTPNGLNEFEKELAPFRSGKGTAQFLFDKPIPWDLITKIIRFRVKELNEKR